MAILRSYGMAVLCANENIGKAKERSKGMSAVFFDMDGTLIDSRADLAERNCC